MEAAASALPIVSTAVSGADEAIADAETGFIVSARDRAALVEKLALLIADPARRARMGAAGRRRIEGRLDPAANTPQQLAIWRKLAAG